MASQEILILGAGELGGAITNTPLDHTKFDVATTKLTLAIRPDTLKALNNGDGSSRTQALLPFRDRGVLFTACDLVEDVEADLAKLFATYTTVIHAGAMTLPSGIQIKVTRAVLAAGVQEYVPWQFGIDYDVIGPEGAFGLFSEQYEIRTLLRSQNHTKWFILSCGVFMSLLFEDFWGVVVRDEHGRITTVRALGGPGHLITATTVEDIARCNAELILVDREKRNQAIFIAGDTISYDGFADLTEKVVGRKVKRETWVTEYLKEESLRDPENKLLKYRVVFSDPPGSAWSKEGTYNEQKGIEMEGIEAYMRRLSIH